MTSCTRVGARLLLLTEKQMQVLDGLRRNRRAVIYGGAGTGKTVLAAERTRRLTGEGFRVLLSCFNRPLADHLRAGFGGVDGVTVHGFHSLCRWQIGHAGMAFPDEPDSDWWEHEAPERLVEAAYNTGFEVDALVVDEGQDFAPAGSPHSRCCWPTPTGDLSMCSPTRTRPSTGRTGNPHSMVPPTT